MQRTRSTHRRAITHSGNVKPATYEPLEICCKGMQTSIYMHAFDFGNVTGKATKISSLLCNTVDNVHSLSVCLPIFLSCHSVWAVQHLAAHVYTDVPYVL